MITTIINEALRGNFSFFILIIGFLQLWLMIKTFKYKGGL